MDKKEIKKILDEIKIDNREEQRQYAIVLENVFTKLGVNISSKETQDQITMLVDGLGHYAIRLIKDAEKQILSKVEKIKN